VIWRYIPVIAYRNENMTGKGWWRNLKMVIKSGL